LHNPPRKNPPRKNPRRQNLANPPSLLKRRGKRGKPGPSSRSLHLHSPGSCRRRQESSSCICRIKYILMLSCPSSGYKKENLFEIKPRIKDPKTIFDYGGKVR